jgi:hypothetical protein
MTETELLDKFGWKEDEIELLKGLFTKEFEVTESNSLLRTNVVHKISLFINQRENGSWQTGVLYGYSPRIEYTDTSFDNVLNFANSKASEPESYFKNYRTVTSRQV